MSYIEEALAKARALAKQAKSARPEESSGGQQRAMVSGGGGGGERRPINYSAPHMVAQAEGRRLFIGGLNYDTTDDSLERYLNTKWPTEEAKVKRDPDGRSRGFAFASFPAVSILESCFDAQPHWVDGKEVSMRKVTPDSANGGGGGGGGGYAGPQGPQPGQKRAIEGPSGMTRYHTGGGTNTRVYIGAPASEYRNRNRGLNDEISDDDLRSYFERWGTVTGVAQHRWEDSGKKKGFGYIEFQEYEAAQACMGFHTICSAPLEVKPYTPGGGGGAAASQTHHPAQPPHNAGASGSYGYGGNGGGYGYGEEHKRARTDLPGQGGPPPDPVVLMEQMKSMMGQMQQMQAQMAQMAGGGSMEQQMAQMQQTMYSMMQNQYMQSMGGQGGYPGYSQHHGYQYPNQIEYPKPPLPPGDSKY